jgi:hypothetical protein
MRLTPIGMNASVLAVTSEVASAIGQIVASIAFFSLTERTGVS